MARPTKLSREITGKICRAIRVGNNPVVSARTCGIAESTYFRWLEEGRASSSGKRRDFLEAVNQAEAEAEARAVAHLSKAIPEDWRAAVAFLERRHPARWRRGRPDDPPKPPEPLKPDLSKLSLEEMKLYRDFIERTQRERPTE